MHDPITEFYVVELPTPAEAEKIADQISRAYLASSRTDGALRPVIWTGSPLAHAGVLFLSVGAVDASRAAGLKLAPLNRIPAEQLPQHRSLLLGSPADRF